MFIPFEIYIEKNKDSLENPENSETKPKSAFEIRSLLRTKFTALSDKKKLKYIKKAEERYDSHDVRFLSTFLKTKLYNLKDFLNTEIKKKYSIIFF